MPQFFEIGTLNGHTLGLPLSNAPLPEREVKSGSQQRQQRNEEQPRQRNTGGRAQHDDPNADSD